LIYNITSFFNVIFALQLKAAMNRKD